MIARPANCPTDRLPELIAERVSAEEAAQIESHLSNCSDCQQAIEQLAGEQEWWRETQSALSDGAIARLGATDDADIETGWLRALLQPPTRDGDWGRLGACDIVGMVGPGGWESSCGAGMPNSIARWRSSYCYRTWPAAVRPGTDSCARHKRRQRSSIPM